MMSGNGTSVATYMALTSTPLQSKLPDCLLRLLTFRIRTDGNWIVETCLQETASQKPPRLRRFCCRIHRSVRLTLQTLNQKRVRHLGHDFLIKRSKCSIAPFRICRTTPFLGSSSLKAC